ncbi:hypothetical protein KC867_00730 [Candidatus Saccharibacteria bacterium]|nr:hypothetical protein [Candidatus Saccharibacteria bacterium]
MRTKELLAGIASTAVLMTGCGSFAEEPSVPAADAYQYEDATAVEPEVAEWCDDGILNQEQEQKSGGSSAYTVEYRHHWNGLDEEIYGFGKDFRSGSFENPAELFVEVNKHSEELGLQFDVRGEWYSQEGVEDASSSLWRFFQIINYWPKSFLQHLPVDTIVFDFGIQGTEGRYIYETNDTDSSRVLRLGIDEYSTLERPEIQYEFTTDALLEVFIKDAFEKIQDSCDIDQESYDYLYSTLVESTKEGFDKFNKFVLSPTSNYADHFEYDIQELNNYLEDIHYRPSSLTNSMVASNFARDQRIIIPEYVIAIAELLDTTYQAGDGKIFTEEYNRILYTINQDRGVNREFLEKYADTYQRSLELVDFFDDPRIHMNQRPGIKSPYLGMVADDKFDLTVRFPSVVFRTKDPNTKQETDFQLFFDDVQGLIFAPFSVTPVGEFDYLLQGQDTDDQYYDKRHTYQELFEYVVGELPNMDKTPAPVGEFRVVVEDFRIQRYSNVIASSTYRSGNEVWAGWAILEDPEG